MKASVKFRDDRKPLFRAKVPLNIVCLPFLSGIIAGDSKELTLNLGTFFYSGPSIRIAYRPNDSYNPFSLSIKTGTGSFGSPISSSMVMSAEFNLLGRQNPSFMLHFKPQFGDFSVKKFHQSSVFDNFVVNSQRNKGVVSQVGSDDSIGVVEAPDFMVKKITELTSRNYIASLFSGVEVAARTAVPIGGRAVVNFRWGARVPSEVKFDAAENSTTGTGFPKIPFLLMNKIGIEHMQVVDSKPNKDGSSSDLAFPGNPQVAEVYSMLKRQLEVLKTENGMLRKSVEDLRQEVASGARFRSGSSAGNFDSGKFSEFERSKNRSVDGKKDRRNEDKREMSSFGGKPTEGDVSEELKKALKEAGRA